MTNDADSRHNFAKINNLRNELCGINLLIPKAKLDIQIDG